MASKFKVEFGRPKERKYFISAHERFFERFQNLQKALDVAFIKENASLSNPDIVVIALSELCVDDFSELLLLCGNGFGHGALKILRGMYERLVTARYLHLHPDEVDAFWKFHAVKLHKMELEGVLKKIDPDGKILDSFKVSRGGRKRLQSSWNNMDFVSMANKVGLGNYMRDAYRLPLEFAHPSVTSILTILESENGQLTIKDIEPQRNMAEVAFVIAHFLILEILRLQVERFGLDDPIFQRCIDDYVYVWGRKKPPSEV
jgi:hypothetical protein